MRAVTRMIESRLPAARHDAGRVGLVQPAPPGLCSIPKMDAAVGLMSTDPPLPNPDKRLGTLINGRDLGNDESDPAGRALPLRGAER